MTEKTPRSRPARASAPKKAPSSLANDPLEWVGTEADPAMPPAPFTVKTPPADRVGENLGAAGQAAAATPTVPLTTTDLPPQDKPRTQEMTNQTDTNSNPAIAAWEKISRPDLLNLFGNPIMIADAKYDIVFCNEAAYRMFEGIEDDIRRDLPHFRARDVIGKNVDIFHKNPQYQRRIMDNMDRPHKGGFTIGGRTLRFIATPQFEGGRVASVAVEWQDATSSLAADAEILKTRDQFDLLLKQMSHMSKEHDAGDIDVFIDADLFEMPEIQTAAKLVNKMVLDHINTKKKAMGVFAAFGEGDFDAPFDRMPGKKVFLNEVIERVRGNFRMLTSETTRMADAIESGKLDADVDVSKFQGEYRTIVQSFERAFASLNSSFRIITEQVEQVGQTVDQMTNASQSLSTNSQITSSSVDEVSASAEETDAQVKANAAAAEKAAKSVGSAAAFAAEGAGKVRDMVSAMDGIKVSSQDIAKIIKVIDEIAFQTNLLALNAAVEAARAGQHGRGFAVVAQEVRNLAGRSAKAARETSDLIEDAANRVNAGVRIADETREAFSRIADEISDVKSVVEEIDRASEEQARGVAQISQAIAEIAKTTLSSSQQADELAATAAQMSAATQQMRGQVNRFQLRKAAPADTRMLSLDQLSPEVLAQLQRLMGTNPVHAAAAPARKNGAHGSLDTDARGYGPF
ncbi:methyl-accepting chemotaxis protein [Roseicyclus mahoneyensis]|uniref:Methyl-accepting chemotaxis protein n=1 Tax=Roseicyclus mahoneyensis TaxID=164332 RepID=A0A316GH42_9RHOB|nr:methyl-accepting chemotaxis protein [Roseicyclus mahoneyensis]PWK60383.1 methyl-accepting chemotaxis protein [Roseicyclus mahoneyensis]